MELEGQIETIIYYNEINSYTIAKLHTESAGEMTIVGYLPFVNVGDSLTVYGEYVTHKDYGKQFKVDTFKKNMPETLEALEKYLASGNVKWIGPKTAKKIIKEFGDDTIKVIENTPEKLAVIKGITEEKALEISASFIESRELWKIVSFLDEIGISSSYAKKVYDIFGINAVEEIKSDPYKLIDIVRGINFKTIDEAALKIGINNDDEQRIMYGIKYGLLLATYNGHTCVIKNNLLDFVSTLLQISESTINEFLNQMKVKGIVVIEERDEEEWVYLTEYYEAEVFIAGKLIRLDNVKNRKHIANIEEKLQKIEKVNKIELSDKQREGIFAVNENNVCVITGGPGTGKTTIIKSIIELYKRELKKVVLCAPTGRAAKKMTETTGEDAKTLHRLLQISKINDTKYINEDIKIEPIDADVVIVDETSMIDLALMKYLLMAVYEGTKLVLVGDVDQLPSVGPGSILKDIIASGRIKVIVLDKIFRQAARSKIILNAHRVNSGKYFIEEKSEELKKDFFFVQEANQERILNFVLSLYKDGLKKFEEYNSFRSVQIITPSKKGEVGTREINKKIQELINPKDKDKKEKAIGATIFREGDTVMQMKNNYDIEWEQGDNIGTGIFNGEMGTITSISTISETVEVDYDGKTVEYTFSDLDQIEHSYAITVHKSQGSEFDVVILPVVRTAPMLLTRNLLYTGITRAKKLLIIVGSKDVIQFMIRNTDAKVRNTRTTIQTRRNLKLRSFGTVLNDRKYLIFNFKIF